MTDITFETPNGPLEAVAEIPSGEGPWPGVVVIHDAFGLRSPHRDIIRRIADNGYLTVRPNLFSRGGGIRCMSRIFCDLLRRACAPFLALSTPRAGLSAPPRLPGAVAAAGFPRRRVVGPL